MLNQSNSDVAVSTVSQTEEYSMIFNGVKYGILSYDRKSRKFNMKLNPKTPTAIRPSIIYGSVVMKNSLKPTGYTPSSSEIYKWICDRTIPRDRQNLDSILSSNGMTSYDPWELMKKNNGKSISDSWEIEKIN